MARETGLKTLGQEWPHHDPFSQELLVTTYCYLFL